MSSYSVYPRLGLLAWLPVTMVVACGGSSSAPPSDGGKDASGGLSSDADGTAPADVPTDGQRIDLASGVDARTADGAIDAAADAAMDARSDVAPVDGATATFRQVGVHPYAAQQRTNTGKMLMTLHPWKGRLYAGYGDGGGNTGPIAIAPFDPITGEFTHLLNSGTEAIYMFRPIGDKLYAPALDRKATADYAVGEPWSDKLPVSSRHAIDMATLDGNDLWIVGSRNGTCPAPYANGCNAAAWRSTDGGATWKLELSKLPQSGKSGDFARFYFAGVYKGKLYVQGHDGQGGAHAASDVFDGTNWSTGPDLLGDVSGWGWHPIVFAGEMVYETTFAGGLLHAFNGTQARAIAGPKETFDVAVDGADLLVLHSDGEIRRTKDLKVWTTIAKAPMYSLSIAVLNGYIYVGDAQSRVYQFGVPLRSLGE